MDCNIYCLVDATGHVYVKDGATSHAEVAANFGLDALGCEAYRFDLAARQLLVGGFLNEVLERLSDPVLVAKLEALIAARFARRGR